MFNPAQASAAPTGDTIELGGGLSIRTIPEKELAEMRYSQNRCACPTLGLFMKGFGRPLDLMDDNRDRVTQGKLPATDILKKTAEQMNTASRNWEQLVPELKDSKEISLPLKQLLSFVAQSAKVSTDVESVPASNTLTAVKNELAKHTSDEAVKQLGFRLITESLQNKRFQLALGVEEAFGLRAERNSSTDSLFRKALLNELSTNCSSFISRLEERVGPFIGTTTESASRKQNVLRCLDEGNYAEFGVRFDRSIFKDAEMRSDPAIRQKLNDTLLSQLQKIAKGPISSDGAALSAWKVETEKMHDLFFVTFHLDRVWQDKPLAKAGGEILQLAVNNKLHKTHPTEFVQLGDFLVRNGLPRSTYQEILQKAAGEDK